MAKVAKKKQTDYTTGGHEISQTAIPLYQKGLGMVDQYVSNPQAAINQYLQNYYEDNTATSDFLRNYKQAMADQVAQNYAATTGGYTSTGQRTYDQRQRDWSDAMARLRDQGVTSSYNMAQGDYNNLLNALGAYNTAYGLGKEYSDIDQYNYMARQQNSFGNQLLGLGGNLMSGVGSVVSAFNPGVGMGLSALGSGLSGMQTQMPGASASTSTAGTGAQQGMFGDTAALQRAIVQQGLWGQKRQQTP